MRHLMLLVATLHLLNTAHVFGNDKFTESLQLEPLDNHLVLGQFKFSVTSSPNVLTTGHYHLFPKSLGEILHKYHIQELELSLTQGLWRYARWGIPSDGVANPPGASILVHFDSELPLEDVDKHWKGLINSLAGFICASLNYADNTVATSPQYTFTPRGAFNANKTFQHSHLRYANLPQENVCTENLTPWKKLLPCGGQAGLSSLLNSKPLFDSNYHSMSIIVRPQCKTSECDSINLNLTLGLSVVLAHPKKDYFTLSFLFRNSVGRECHIAESSTVVVKFPTVGKLSLHLESPPDNTVSSEQHTLASYKVTSNFNLKASYKVKPTYGAVAPPVLHTLRYLSGYGQEYGSIVCEITNNAEELIQIVYMEYIPWFLRIYLHTLSITSNGSKVPVSKLLYSPGLERKKPSMFELLLNLPANATTVIRFDVEKLFLKWTEYPPDANLGFHVPAAIITGVIPDAPEGSSIQMLREGYGVVRFYTEKLVVLLPTPDFSMPYNVICLACTVVALAFGSIHNLTTKILIRPKEKKIPIMQRITRKIKKVLGFKVEEAVTSTQQVQSSTDKTPAGETTPRNETSVDSEPTVDGEVSLEDSEVTQRD